MAHVIQLFFLTTIKNLEFVWVGLVKLSETNDLTTQFVAGTSLSLVSFPLAGVLLVPLAPSLLYEQRTQVNI